MSKQIKFSQQFITEFNGSYTELENIINRVSTMIENGDLTNQSSTITFGSDYDQILEISL
jgi:hypothetical protein